MLIVFYNTALSVKKVSLFNLLFQIRAENQSASLPWQLQLQLINFTGGVEGLKSAA